MADHNYTGEDKSQYCEDGAENPTQLVEGDATIPEVSLMDCYEDQYRPKKGGNRLD